MAAAVAGLTRNLGGGGLPLGSGVGHSSRTTHTPSVTEHRPPQYRRAHGLPGKPTCPKGKNRAKRSAASWLYYIE